MAFVFDVRARGGTPRSVKSRSDFAASIASQTPHISKAVVLQTGAREVCGFDRDEGEPSFARSRPRANPYTSRATCDDASPSIAATRCYSWRTPSAGKSRAAHQLGIHVAHRQIPSAMATVQANTLMSV